MVAAYPPDCLGQIPFRTAIAVIGLFTPVRVSRLVQLIVPLCAVLAVWPAQADYLKDQALHQAVVGKTLTARTANDGKKWYVRFEGSGIATFQFVNGNRRQARYRIDGARIDFVFQTEKTCRSIWLTGNGRQEWRDCDTGAASSTIVAPTFDAAVAPTAATLPTGLASRLALQIDTLKAAGYSLQGETRAAPVSSDSPLRSLINLPVKKTYALIAVCEACTHVALTLRGKDGAVIAESSEQSPTVIVTGPGRSPAEHTAEVSVPGCQQTSCLAAFAVVAKPE
jgi:hypothetical protein